MRKPNGKIKDLPSRRKQRRRLHIRSKVVGSADRPRIYALKTNKHLAVQVVNDEIGKTLFAVQTYGKEAVKEATNNKEGAKLLGAKVAEKMKENNLTKAVYDRAGYRYTGVIASLVESIRENGIQV